MNKIKAICVLLVCLVSTTCFAEPRWYNATHPTLGSGSLDSIDGQNLVDGDRAIVVTSTSVYHYILDADASGTDTSPGVINPDTNAGTKSWMLTSGPLDVDNALGDATSGTGEDDLKSTTIPANLMVANKCLYINGAGTVSGSNDTKVVKLHFGTSSWTVISEAAGDTNDWLIDAKICTISATSQRLTWHGLESDGTETGGYETATINTAAAVTLKLTGTCANAGDQITHTMWEVRLY